MRRRMVALILSFLMVAGLVGCGTTQETQTGETVEGLEELGEMQVVAREEGSGTRSVFGQLTGLVGDDGEDQTTVDAQIEENADLVVQSIGETTGSIGYISTGTDYDTDKIKVLGINGTKPSVENIEKGKYPLSRSFYLAYSGNLDELQQDFLTYVKGKGQEIVEKTLAPIAKSSSFLSSQTKGTLTIHGSTSVTPVMKQLATEYMQLNANATVEVEASDSTQGLNDAMQGACDFGMASRELEDYEKELLNYEMIARDGIAVIVNSKNPLETLTTEQLKEIYTGDLKNWEDLNP